jgi:Protein of unknown function (DUF2934)
MMTGNRRFKKVLVMVKNTTLPAFIVVSAGDIAVRAYQIYVDRGRAHGLDREDWFRAERELKAPEAPDVPARKVGGTRDRGGARASS